MVMCMNCFLPKLIHYGSLNIYGWKKNATSPQYPNIFINVFSCGGLISQMQNLWIESLGKTTST